MNILFKDTMTKLLFVILLILALCFGILKYIVEYTDIGREAQTFYISNLSDDSCALNDVTAKCIGKTYHGSNAEPGYSFYLIFLHITNSGTEPRRVEYLGFYPEDYLSGDVIEGGYAADLLEDNDFTYENAPIVPAGEETTVAYYLQVRDGIQIIHAKYYGDDNNGRGTRLEITL